MTRASIGLALLASVAQYGALTLASHDVAHSATLKCTDGSNPWTLVVSDGGTSASLWQDNVSNGSIRTGTYTVTEGYTVAKFQDGYVRLKDNAQGDFTFGAVSGGIECRDNAKPAPAPAKPATAKSDPAPAYEGPMTYSLSKVGDRTLIYASGEFALDEADRFNKWRHSLPQDYQAAIRIGAVTFVFNSGGGIIGGAADLAVWIRDNKMDTLVPNDAVCASACVLAWGAGYRKAVSVTAHMGVHGALSTKTDPTEKAGEEAAGTLYMARMLSDEKAPANLIAAIATTDAKDMHWMVADDAIAWGGVMLDTDGKPMDPAANAPTAPVWGQTAKR
jgi:hypothetical protein